MMEVMYSFIFLKLENNSDHLKLVILLIAKSSIWQQQQFLV